MSSVIHKLRESGHITPPTWMDDNVRYETIMGSTAYGVNEGDSDWDMVGFCIPPKDMVFPHLAGIIPGFGHQQQRFKCWQKHHVETKRRVYDLNCEATRDHEASQVPRRGCHQTIVDRLLGRTLRQPCYCRQPGQRPDRRIERYRNHP